MPNIVLNIKKSPLLTERMNTEIRSQLISLNNCDAERYVTSANMPIDQQLTREEFWLESGNILVSPVML